jgi:hypothetical protein
VSLQADSEERDEIELNVKLIDAKVQANHATDQVDVYDLNNMSLTKHETTALGLKPPTTKGGALLYKESVD